VENPAQPDPDAQHTRRDRKRCRVVDLPGPIY